MARAFRTRFPPAQGNPCQVPAASPPSLHLWPIRSPHSTPADRHEGGDGCETGSEQGSWFCWSAWSRWERSPLRVGLGTWVGRVLTPARRRASWLPMARCARRPSKRAHSSAGPRAPAACAASDRCVADARQEHNTSKASTTDRSEGHALASVYRGQEVQPLRSREREPLRWTCRW